jgi:DHA1 family multidrug resistance protein-like MFS transporter
MTTRSPSVSMFILLFVLVIVMLGFGIIMPLMPSLISHFQASGYQLGLIMAIYSLMQFLFAPLWGRWSDRIGRKPVLLIGIAGFAISFVIQAFSPNVWVFLAARAVAGILSSATLPTASAYIADTTTLEKRSAGMGLMGAALGVGMIFGPFLGGVLTKWTPSLPANLSQVAVDASSGATINLSIPFLFSAFLALLLIPFIIFVLPESLSAQARQISSQRGTNQFGQLWQAVRTGPTAFLFVMAFLFAFAMANMESVLGLYAQDRFSVGPSQLGIWMGVMGVLSVIQQGVLFAPLVRRFGEERLLQAGLLTSALGFIGMAVIPNLWGLFASTGVYIVGSTLLGPAVNTLISKRATTGQGTALGLGNSFQSLGRAIGPMWAGTAFDVWPTLSFWTGAVIQALALFISLRVMRPLPQPGNGPPQPGQPVPVMAEEHIEDVL